MVGLNQAVDRIFRYGADFLTQVSINGMYGFVLYDNVSDTYIGARDPIGIIPLYIGYGKDGSLWFSSVMKALWSLSSFIVNIVITSNSFQLDIIWLESHLIASS